MLAIVVVPNDMLAIASAAVQQIYPENEGDVFGRQLSPTGHQPGTHWLTAPSVDEQVEQALRGMASSPDFSACALEFADPSNAWDAQQALFERLGLQLIEGE